MINVMGEQVQSTCAVINSTVAGGTVSSAASSARCCCYQAVVVTSRIGMTGGTGVMDRVVKRIGKGACNDCCVMAGIAVSGNRQGHTAGGCVINMTTCIDMTSLAVAGCRHRINQTAGRRIDQAAVDFMTCSTVVMNLGVQIIDRYIGWRAFRSVMANGTGRIIRDPGVMGYIGVRSYCKVTEMADRTVAG